MLFIDIKPIFLLRGINNPVPLLIKAGISRHSVFDLMNSSARAVRLDHLEILCDVLNCEIADLLSFRPDAGKNYPADHPLLKLVKEDLKTSVQQTVAKMSLSELRAFTKAINQKKTE